MLMLSANVNQIGLFFCLWLMLWFPIAVVLSKWLNWQPFQPPTLAQKIPLVLSLYAIAPLVIWGILRWTHRAWADYGLPPVPSFLWMLATGFAIGVLSLAGLFNLYLLMGWSTFNTSSLSFSNTQRPSNDSQKTVSSTTQPQSNNLNSGIDGIPLLGQRISKGLTPKLLTVISLLGLSLVIGWVEELIFRGFLTYQLSQTFSVWQTGAIVSSIFAVLHLVWDGKEGRVQLPGLWLMGIVLTIAWWVNHQAIYLAWGLHTGWVWTMALVDSFDLIHYSETGSPWLTGFDGKPLAGLMGIMTLLITGVLIGYLV